MDTPSRRGLFLALHHVVLPDLARGQTRLACLNCQGLLEIHQPDIDQPERMLATCVGCKSWHLVEHDEETSTTILALLPNLRPLLHPSRLGLPG